MRTDRYSPIPAPYLLYGFLGVSLALNTFMVVKMTSDDAPSAAVEAADPVADILVEEAALAADIDVAPELTPTTADNGWTVVHGTITHSLARTFQKELGSEDGDVVSAVYSRLFMWDLDLRKDLQKGDEVTVVFRLDDAGEVEMPVAWYQSQKLGRTLKAYSYQAGADSYASYWYDDGTEVPLRLVGGPIESYEQITSLLKDRPTHKGMDFKADVGSNVLSPKAATVTRVNWNWANNGNCVELRYADGTTAKFLHLEKVDVDAGQHVKSGQIVASSGNTGKSTAPHLHYQLDRGGKTLDPLEYHDTVRRTMPEGSLAAFASARNAADALIDTEVASR